MKIGIIGAGSVGQTLAAKLIANGHDVALGIRNPSPAELAKERQMAEPLNMWQKKPVVKSSHLPKLPGMVKSSSTQQAAAFPLKPLKPLGR